MRASLAADGQQSAVTVITATSGTRRYVLVDGYLRMAALRALGRDVVLAVCVELSDSDALIMAHRLDETGRRSALDDAGCSMSSCSITASSRRCRPSA